MDYKPTYLYIKRHKKTGLYYFGKTIKDPLSYTGSGVYWSSHLKKHGNDVETIWHQLFTNKEELKEVATNFSNFQNIVESENWANLIPENGFTGGDTGISNEGRKRLSEASGQRKHSIESIKKIKKARSQQPCPRQGKFHSLESIDKIREARKKQIITDETREKISEANKGRVYTEERNKKIADSLRGRNFSTEHKANISAAAKKRKKVTCIHCKKVSTPGNIARWHNDNCRGRIL